MPPIKKLDDLKDFASYKLHLARTAKDVDFDAEDAIFIPKFAFSTGTPRALLLVGPQPPGLKKEILAAHKATVKVGRCTRNEEGKLVFDKVNPHLAKDALDQATVTEEVEANAKVDEVVKARVRARLSEHLESTGRATGDSAKREAITGEILQGMEDTANDRRTKAKTGQALAHHVSAHGPDTDQISRLVTGRRSDELTDPSVKKVKLTGNTGGVGDSTVPVYDKVGENPNVRSGKFTTNAVMLQVMEEAYAQVALLETHLSQLLKTANDKRYTEIMQATPVAEAAEEVRKSRAAADAVLVKLRKKGLSKSEIEKLVEESEQLDLQAEYTLKTFTQIFQKEAANHPLLRPEDLDFANARLARVVQPIRTANKPGGTNIGDGYELVDPNKRQNAKDRIGSDTVTPEQEMQTRFENIKKSGEQSSATVVMDPVVVKKKIGGVDRDVRVGWEVQTAYPNDNAPSEGFETPGGVQNYLDGGREVRRIEAALRSARLKKDGLTKDLESLDKEILRVTGVVDSKKKKALPPLRKARDAAQQNLDNAPLDEELKKKRDAAALRVTNVENELLSAENELTKLKEEAKTERPALLQSITEATDKIIELEKELVLARSKTE